jgi:CHASE2 domain-containing sensor protein
VGPSLAAFVEYLAYPGEFGWLLPLLLVGAYVLWRQQRTAFAVLVTWMLTLATIYAPEHTTALFRNGARYLLPAFPALSLPV